MSAAESVETRFEAIAVTTGKPVKLAMQQLSLSGEVLPVGARLAVRHVFRSAERKPIEVIYSFGLPRDAALRRFEIFGEGFRARSELKPVEEAAAPPPAPPAPPPVAAVKPPAPQPAPPPVAAVKPPASAAATEPPAAQSTVAKRKTPPPPPASGFGPQF